MSGTSLSVSCWIASLVLLLLAVVGGHGPSSVSAFVVVTPVTPIGTFLTHSRRRNYINLSPSTPTALHMNAISSSGLWNVGAQFGKGPFRFFRSLDEWMKAFPDEDRVAFPELFQLPTGVIEVSLPKPLGLLLEEVEPGRGVKVEGFVSDGNAERLASNLIQPGDVLVGITAVKIVGAKWERRMIPCRNFDYDAVVGAIISNDRKWGCEDVVLWLERPGLADPDKTNAFLEFYEPPFETPWKQRQ